MQPIQKSKSTSFMFNKNFCEIKGKKVIHWAGGLGEWGSRPNCFLEVQFQYLLGYPSILLRYQSNNHTFRPSIGSFRPSIYSFFYLATTLLKRDIFRHSKVFAAHGFQPTASDWLLCEEETGAHYQLHRLTHKLWILFFKFFKVAYFSPQKIRTFQNIP